MAKDKKSLFDILEDLSKGYDVVKSIADSIRETRPNCAKFLDEARIAMNNANIDINGYLNELILEGPK